MPTERDTWYDHHAPMRDGLLDICPSGTANPEELLMAAEETSGVSVLERAAGRMRRHQARHGRSLPSGRFKLRALSKRDRDLLLQAYGHELSQRQIADLHGCRQQSIQERLDVVKRRLEWLLGPGSLFNGQDIHNDFAWMVTHEERKTLILYWRLRSRNAVARIMREQRRVVARRFQNLVRNVIPRLIEHDAERYAKYAQGFRALAEWMVGQRFRGM